MTNKKKELRDVQFETFFVCDRPINVMVKLEVDDTKQNRPEVSSITLVNRDHVIEQIERMLAYHQGYLSHRIGQDYTS